MDITLSNKQNTEVARTTWEDLLSQSPYTILFFYPKDNTPGCSRESKDFSDMLNEFTALWCQVVGVSKDWHESHCRFIAKHELELSLIVDTSLVLHDKFSTIGEKNSYGRITRGVIRSTFLLNQSWDVVKEWRNVKATWHAQRIYKAVLDLSL